MKHARQWLLAAVAVAAVGLPQAARAADYEFESLATLLVNGQVRHAGSSTGISTSDDARLESFAASPSPLSFNLSLMNASSGAIADFGDMSYSAALTAATHYQAQAYGEGQFVDFLTFTGTTDRLRVSFDYRVDATIAAAFEGVDGGSRYAPSISAYTGLAVEALSSADLVGGAGSICNTVPVGQFAGNRGCSHTNQSFISSPGPFALTGSFTVEINNGSSLMLLGLHYGTAEQRAGENPDSDPSTFDYPATSIASSFLLPRISGVGLTGVQSRGLGALLAIDGSPGAFSYAAGAVPEPASWAMLIAGFGLVGAVLRRRREHPDAAPAQP